MRVSLNLCSFHCHLFLCASHLSASGWKNSWSSPFFRAITPPSQVECITLYLFVSIKYLKLIFAWKLPAKPKRLSSKMQFLTSFTKTFGRVTRTSSSDSAAEEFAEVIPGFSLFLFLCFTFPYFSFFFVFFLLFLFLFPVPLSLSISFLARHRL